VVIVGAGFGGLSLLRRMRADGRRVRLFEAGSDVGGVWYWNRYPGARCDVQSMEYSYAFDEELAQQWKWPERYSDQQTIHGYLRTVAARHQLREDIQFNTRVTAAAYDEQARRWQISTDRSERVSARFLLLASDVLSATNIPDIPQRELFQGRVVHTGAWPKDSVELAGKRVAVIGTGSSGVQSIPAIAEVAAELTVFQRTPGYILPAANDPLDPQFEAEVKGDYAGWRAYNSTMKTATRPRYATADHGPLDDTPEERKRLLEDGWATRGLVAVYPNMLTDKTTNHVVSEFVRTKIREIVKDPQTAEKLVPWLPVGCKRTCYSQNYYETFNEPHVRLVDVRNQPIMSFTPTGLKTANEEYELDLVVFATGYDALAGAILRVDITGREGRSLRSQWADGPRTYLGLGTVNFPNLFPVAGPGSPSALSNGVVSIEQQTRWIADCLDYLDEHGYSEIEATEAAQDDWVEKVNQAIAPTVYAAPNCTSWYLGSNIEGKPRAFVLYYGFPDYVRKCGDVARNDFEGFTLTRQRQ
jgi:cation diffusion facilitator CzcD-associated flavoprotein CzcO